MSTQSPELKVRPAAKWYLVPALMWLAALVLFMLFLVSLVRFLNGELSSVENGGPLQVAEGGFTVYGEAQDSGSGDCTVTSEAGETTSLDSIDVNLEVTIEGENWTALASSEEDLLAGRYTLTCEGASERLAIGERIDVGGIALSAVWGFVVPGLLGLAGLITIIVLAVKRSRSKAQVRQAQMYAADQGYGTAWQQMQHGGQQGYPPPPPPPYDPNRPDDQPPYGPDQPSGPPR
jgi:hypothetical protein